MAEYVIKGEQPRALSGTHQRYGEVTASAGYVRTLIADGDEAAIKQVAERTEQEKLTNVSLFKLVEIRLS